MLKMAKLTCSKLKEMIKDEEKGAENYKRYNLQNLARDEQRHSEFLRRLKEGKKCQKS